MRRLEHLCGEFGWRAYEKAPIGADVLFRLGRRYVMPLLRYATPLVRVHGRAIADGEPGSLLIAGAGAQLLHLQRQFLAGELRAEALGTCPIPALPRALLALGRDDDLIVARVARPLASLVFDQRFLRVPELVDVWIDVRDREQMRSRMSQTMRQTARRLLAGGYSWSEAHDPAAFERFYDCYYLPFVRARHDELAIVDKRPILRRNFSRGGVMWITTRDNEEVAGCLYRVDGRIFSLLVLGTLGGSLEARCEGVLDAIKLFGIEYALGRGLEWVNFGGCLPSPRDGSLSNKRAWGGELRDRRDSHHDLLVRWPRFTPRVGRLLADMPVFVREREGFAALAAVPTGEPRLASQLWRQWRMPGLERLHIVASDGWRAWRRGETPPPPGRLRLCAAGAAEDVLA